MANKGNGKHFHTRSDGYRSRTYKSWDGMIGRCYGNDPSKQKAYRDNGIKVCERWQGEHGFENFLADMGERPEGMTLDRYPNKKGNYGPDNCRWATNVEQARNRNDNLDIKFKGEVKPLSEWCELLGLKYSRIWMRLQAGLTPDIALSEGKYSKKIMQIKMLNLAAKKAQ